MSISVILLTYNEELHIERCIESLVDVADNIYVMDSFSTDATLSILSKYSNVSIKKNKFINYSTQFNLALDLFEIKDDWVLRIDADEYIDNDLARFLKHDVAEIKSEIKGVYFNRHMTFLGRKLKYGGMSSYWMLRLWRNGFGRCEQTWMDEHIILESGDTMKASGTLVDDNLNTLSWWAHKHVNYSTREAIDIIQRKQCYRNEILKSRLFGSKVERLRFIKNIYNRAPLFVRPFVYFLHRYFFLAGFLDGRQGFLWCVLQGFWYRTMVDAKVFELYLLVNDETSIEEVVKNKYGYEI